MLFTFDLWAPTYSYTIRDEEFDIYGDGYQTTLKNLKSKLKKFDICVLDENAKAPYITLKSCEIQKPFAKMTKKIKNPILIDEKVFLGEKNLKVEPTQQKLKITKSLTSFTADEIDIPYEKCLEYLSSSEPKDNCTAEFQEHESGLCYLLLSRESPLETYKLQLPVEIEK